MHFPGEFQLLKRTDDKLLSNFACFGFNCNLRHYNTAVVSTVPAATAGRCSLTLLAALTPSLTPLDFSAFQLLNLKYDGPLSKFRLQLQFAPLPNGEQADDNTGKALQVNPGFLQLTPRLVSKLETKTR